MSPTARRIPTGWRLVVLVGSLSIFGPLCIDMYLPALPDISRQMQASASAVQLTLTGCLIGISVGQLVVGSISDRVGRRGPLLIGLIAFAASSIACALAPNIYVLIACRTIQGAGGAAGIVIARSIVRDLHSGVALVKFFSTLMLATGLGPILAPQIGSWTLSYTSWRGVFVILGAFGAILLISAWWRIPETFPPHLRVPGTAWSSLGTMISIGRDRRFLGYALACGLGMGGAFAYISGSSFVLQNIYGLSPKMYGLLFALNACGLIVGAQLNGWLASRFEPSALLTAGLLIMCTGGTGILTVVTTGAVGLVGVFLSMLCLLFGLGFVGPNALSLALQLYPQAAGSASALLGSFQFGLAAVVAPLAGLRGTADALPMAALMLVLPAAGLVGFRVLAGTRGGQPVLPGSEPAPVLAVVDPV